MSGARLACPKCGHRPPAPIGATEACPACGVYMHKIGVVHVRKPTVPSADADSWGDGIAPEFVGAVRSRIAFLKHLNFLAIPGSGPVENLVRLALLVFLAVWGAYLASCDIRDGEIGGSFMHNILLPIHEAGHVLFMPFGEFLTIAGGSFFQVFFPFAIGVAFLVKNRDPFGAAVCLWWTGISLIDLAPYVYDALDPQLILLGGRTGEDGPHDWIYLFETLGGLQQSHLWGRAVHVTGSLVALSALLWAALALWHSHRHASADERIVPD